MHLTISQKAAAEKSFGFRLDRQPGDDDLQPATRRTAGQHFF
jgi:hypothetical protein